jgi:hypothetical protein
MFKSITLYREKVQWYFRKIDSKNMYTENVKKEKILNLEFKGFMIYL